ncbi:MarR family winged helix-turn-helix transcriptional regulator [Rhizobium helianthi]|uniref:MarR family winged helix-turn-helix transcriptional regulator n=1 Tax=Rhizobium helianthi TaxID=1132695 RepID=A0ABW4M218_9HYPH
MEHEPDGSESLRLEDLIGYHLRRASIIDLQGASSVLDPLGTRLVPLSVLAKIIEHPGTTSAEICRMLGMQRANIVSILAELEGKSLVAREADPLDQRLQRLSATEAGMKAGQQWLSLLRQHEERVFARLSCAERDQLRDLLARIWQSDEG